jgi:hypothetical protein
VSYVIWIALLSFTIVMCGMLLLASVCALLRRSSGEPHLAADPSPAAESLDPVLLAVITAAVSQAIGRRVRIHRVHVHRASAERWSRAGRMDVMISHRVGPTR